MTDKNTPVIAFVGLGSMGLGMAKNLLKHSASIRAQSRAMPSSPPVARRRRRQLPPPRMPMW
jgi:3-hydroxyisobutyrate dehydrogenase-like beta-hydroxyacid dehydrogenase